MPLAFPGEGFSRPRLGRVELVEQGRERLGQLGIAGGLGKQAGELFGAQFAAEGCEAAPTIHRLRDAEPELDHECPYMSADSQPGAAAPLGF